MAEEFFLVYDGVSLLVFRPLVERQHIRRSTWWSKTNCLMDRKEDTAGGDPSFSPRACPPLIWRMPTKPRLLMVLPPNSTTGLWRTLIQTTGTLTLNSCIVKGVAVLDEEYNHPTYTHLVFPKHFQTFIQIMKLRLHASKSPTIPKMCLSDSVLPKPWLFTQRVHSTLFLKALDGR